MPLTYATIGRRKRPIRAHVTRYGSDLQIDNLQVKMSDGWAWIAMAPATRAACHEALLVEHERLCEPDPDEDRDA